VSSGRLGVKTRRCGTLTQGEAAKRGREATGRGALGHGKLRTRPVGTALTWRGVGSAVEAACEARRRSASDTGAAAAWRRHGSWRGQNGGRASKYPCGTRPDSAAHSSQPGRGTGRQCH
jgi:hypothetical protein